MNYNIEDLFKLGSIAITTQGDPIRNDLEDIVAGAITNNPYERDEGRSIIANNFRLLERKVNAIKELIQNDYEITLSIGNTSEVFSNTVNCLDRLDSLLNSAKKWSMNNKATESLLHDEFSSLVTPSVGRIPKPSAYVTDEVKSIANNIVDSSIKANERLLGDPNVSLSIGYIEFSEKQLGPDSVTISDINEVSLVSSLRSRTDVALKGSAGRSVIELDIVFPDKDSINNVFRPLIGMLKMAPIIPVGGSALAIALINRITASAAYQSIKHQYYNVNNKLDSSVENAIIKSLMVSSDIPEGISSDILKDLIVMDSQSVDFLLRRPVSERTPKAAEVDKRATKNINVADLIPESLKTIVISVAVDSITVSTVASMPGAIRARISLMRHHDMTAEGEQIRFINESGDPTYDIRQCKPLIDAVDIIYLSPERRDITVKNRSDNEYKKYINKDYIPLIGDRTNYGSTVSGIDLVRIKESDSGHNLYTRLDGGDSPVAMRYATLKDPQVTIEYIPDRLILQSVTWSMQNKIAMIPMVGEIYPAVQFMGRSSISGTMTFMSDDRAALQEFMTVKSSMDEISTARSLGQLLRREYLDIYNDVLNLSGSFRFILSSATIQTAPDNPGLFMLSIQFISNEETVDSAEELEIVESNKATDKEREEFWWWMYGALSHRFYNAIPKRLEENTSLIINGPYNGLSAIGLSSIQKSTRLVNSNDALGASKDFNNYTTEEIELILGLLKGNIGKLVDATGTEDVYNEGMVNHNAIKATVIDMISKFEINKEVLDSSITYKAGYDSDEVKGTISNFIKDKINDPSKYLELNKTLDSFDEKYDGPQSVEIVLNNLYKNSYVKSSNNTNYIFKDYPLYNDDFIISTQHSAARFYAGIIDDIKNVPSEISESKVTMGVIQDLGHSWIPTPTMWQRLYSVLNKPGEYRTKSGGNLSTYRGLPAGKLYAKSWWADSLPTFDHTAAPMYLITRVWKQFRDLMNAYNTNPGTRRTFGSFFSDPSRRKLYEQVGKSGFSIGSGKLPEYHVDPIIFEKRNTYKDLGLPRYSEIFSSDPFSSDTKPKLTNDGYEVWRKVAPTYAEIGESANIYRSLSGLINQNGRMAFTHPPLLTPRAFNDYCDPGFFYFKHIWINDSYSKFLEELKHGTTENTKFSPAGNSGNFLPSWLETQKRRVLHQDSSTLKIMLPNFSLANKISPTTNTEKFRPSKTNDEDIRIYAESMHKPIIDAALELTKEDFLSSKDGQDLNERIKSAGDKEVRVLVLDSEGVQVGLLVVSKKGNQSGNKNNIGFKSYKSDDGKFIVNIPNKNNFSNPEYDNKSIQLIDMTDDFNKPADKISYRSSSQMIKYNEFAKAESNATLKREIEFIGDRVLNKVRNYPTFKVYFVREHLLANGDLELYRSDDMYGYASVISFDIMHDKEDASTAVITLTDITGVLSSSLFRRQVVKIGNKDNDSTSSSEELLDNIPNGDTPEKIMLEVGTNIVVKMGYGQDPDYLETVFTGAIAELQPGDVTTIIAQSYRTELFKYVNFYGTNSVIGALGALTGYSTKKHWTHPIFLIHHILVKLGKVAMVETDLQFSGLPHFGRFMTLADFENSDPGVKDRFNTRYDGNGNKIESYNDEVNKNVPSQEKASSFIPNLGVGAAAGVGYVGAAALAASLLSNPIGWGTLVVGGIIGGLAGFANKMQRYAALYDDLHIYTDTMRNVFISDGWESACCDYLDDEWIADGSGWNCLKEITRYKVNHICTEVPYGNMATLYIGKPDGRYHYKPLDAKSIQYYSQMTPILNKFALNKLTENLITPFLNSYEYKGSNLQYETTLYYDFIDSNKVVDIISGVESSSNKYQILFSNSIFKHPESLDSYKNAVKVIEPAIVNIFGTKGTLKEDIPDLSNLEISKEDKSSYRMSELGVSLRNNNIFILDSIKLENLINQSGGIDGRTIEISDSANNGIPITLDLANLTPGQVRELGYLNQDVIAFKSTGTTLRIANKNELSKYNINPLDGLPNGKTYIKLDDDKVIRTSSELFTNSLSFYDKDGMGTIVKLTRASSKNSLDFKFELQNNINRLFRIAQTEVPDKVSVWIGLVNDNSDDLKFIQDTLSASGDSFLKYLFCYFFGIKKTELKDGTTSIKFSLNNRDFGNLDELAVEFTRALMDGTKFSRGVDEISGGNTTKSAEEEVINFNRYISEMVRSYTYGTDKTINYGSIKDSGEKIDIDIAKQVFGDNLIDAIEQGFLSNDELSRYISNAESIINNVVPDSKLPTEVKEAKNNARERASTQSVSNNEISSNDSDSIGDVIMFNADKYKLFLIFLAKFLRANPDIASGSRGISATIDWLSESIPPDQKNFRKTHIILSGVDIVENNITASLSQMHNNVLLFGPKDIEVKSSGEEETEENNIWTVDEAETTWVPFPNFSQSGVDFNPYVSPETRKQLQVRERNAETDTQKAALLINHLAEAMRPMYRGNIKVIGRHIKPYDLLLIIDQHNDMMGFVEVERVVHNFSATEGWITTVTPHAYVVPIDEVQNVAARFSTKTLELMLFGIRVLDTAFNIAMFYSIFAAPLNKAIGKAITNIGTSAAAATVKGTVTTDIAGKSAKGFIRDFLYSKLEQQTWFKAYVTEATSQLAGHNVSAEVKQQLIRRNAVKLFVESNSDWMAKGEIMKALGSSALEGLGLPKLAMAYLGRDIIYDGFSAYTSMVTECQIASTILPIHVFCLTKNARVFSAGLDTKLSNYYNYSDRIGYSINSARSALNNTLYGLFTTESNGGRGSNLTSPSSVLGPR